MVSGTASMETFRKLILEADARFIDKYRLCVANKQTNMNLYSDRTYNLRHQVSHHPELMLDPHFMTLLQATETYLAPEFSAVAAHQQGVTEDLDGRVRGRALSGLLAGLLKTLLRETVGMGGSSYLNDTHNDSIIYHQGRKGSKDDNVDITLESDAVSAFRPSKSYAMRKIFIEMISHWFQAKEREILDFTLHCRLSKEIKAEKEKALSLESVTSKRLMFEEDKLDLDINNSTLDEKFDISRTTVSSLLQTRLTDDDVLRMKQDESAKTNYFLPLGGTTASSNNTPIKYPFGCGSVLEGQDLSNNCSRNDQDEATATMNKNQRIKEKLTIFKSRNLASALSLRSLAFSTASGPVKTPAPPIVVYTKDLQQRRQDKSKDIHVDALYGYSGPPTLLHGPPSASYAPEFQNNPSGYSTGLMRDSADGRRQRVHISTFDDSPLTRERGLVLRGSGASTGQTGVKSPSTTLDRAFSSFSPRNSQISSHLSDHAIVSAEIKTISHLTKRIAEEHDEKERHDTMRILSASQARIDEESARRIETESLSSQTGRTFARVLMARSHLHRAVSASTNITRVAVAPRAMSTNVLEVGLSSSGQPQLGKVWDGSNNLICHSLIDGWECAAGKESTLDESLAFSLARRAMGHAAAGDINMYRNLLVDDKDKKNYGIPAEEIKDGPNITTLSPYDNRIATPVEVIRILKSLKNRNDKYASQPAVTHVGAVQSSNLKILPSSQGKSAMGGEADSICLGEKFGLLAPDARNGPYRFNEHRHHSSLLDPVLDVVVAPDCVTTKQIPRLDVPIYEQLLRVSSGNGKKGRRQSHQPTQSLEQQRYILSSFPSLRQLEQLRLSDRVRTSFAQSGTKGPHVTRYSGTYKMCVEPMDESYEDCLSLLPFPSDGLPSDPSLVWKKKRKKISKRSKS